MGTPFELGDVVTWVTRKIFGEQRWLVIEVFGADSDQRRAQKDWGKLQLCEMEEVSPDTWKPILTKKRHEGDPEFKGFTAPQEFYRIILKGSPETIKTATSLRQAAALEEKKHRHEGGRAGRRTSLPPGQIGILPPGTRCSPSLLPAFL